MGKLIDLSGLKFGKLTVIDSCGVDKDKKLIWNCLCDCGNSKKISGNSLRRGFTKTCGCKYKDGNNKTHNLTKTVEYRVWADIKTRCLNKNCKNWKYYGERGIKISDDWLNSFVTFLNDMGKRPSKKHSIDRVDVNGDYCKENCRWVTIDIQSKNKRNSKTLIN